MHPTYSVYVNSELTTLLLDFISMGSLFDFVKCSITVHTHTREDTPGKNNKQIQ